MITQRNKMKKTIIHIQKVQQIMCHNSIQFTMEEFGNATFKLWYLKSLVYVHISQTSSCSLACQTFHCYSSFRWFCVFFFFPYMWCETFEFTCLYKIEHWKTFGGQDDHLFIKVASHTQAISFKSHNNSYFGTQFI